MMACNSLPVANDGDRTKRTNDHHQKHSRNHKDSNYL